MHVRPNQNQPIRWFNQCHAHRCRVTASFFLLPVALLFHRPKFIYSTVRFYKNPQQDNKNISKCTLLRMNVTSHRFTGLSAPSVQLQTSSGPSITSYIRYLSPPPPPTLVLTAFIFPDLDLRPEPCIHLWAPFARLRSKLVQITNPAGIVIITIN